MNRNAVQPVADQPSPAVPKPPAEARKGLFQFPEMSQAVPDTAWVQSVDYFSCVQRLTSNKNFFKRYL